MEDKSKVLADGWHQASESLRYYVEDGKLLRGVRNEERTVYPYLANHRFGGYDNASGIKATRRNLERVSWQ